ncbi:hypothetical protein EIP86_006075 [Pleurotus ostreatoroseus]|nr:hypothetical protein EIP86_006075 [Pleurotus ostreatoroseus]
MSQSSSLIPAVTDSATSATSTPVPSQGPFDGDTTTQSVPPNPTAADLTGGSSSVQPVSRARVYAIAGGVGVACALLVLVVFVLVWRKKRWSTGRWRRVVHDGMQGGAYGIFSPSRRCSNSVAWSAADLEPEGRTAYTTSQVAGESVSGRTLVEDTEKGALEHEDIQPYRDETIESHHPDFAASPSNDRETTGTPAPDNSHPHSIPIPPIPRVPPPAYWTRRRRSTDGGVRLAGRELSLRRVGTASSSGAASVDSLTTLPPAYQPSY